MNTRKTSRNEQNRSSKRSEHQTGKPPNKNTEHERSILSIKVRKRNINTIQSKVPGETYDSLWEIYHLKCTFRNKIGKIFFRYKFIHIYLTSKLKSKAKYPPCLV